MVLVQKALQQYTENNKMLLTQNLEQIQTQAFPSSAPLSQISLGSLINSAIPYIIGIAGIALLFVIVMGGFQLMYSKGDPKAMQAAQAKITYALVGFVVVVFAYLIVQLVARILGLQVTLFGSMFNAK